jgi:hypothetical protein
MGDIAITEAQNGKAIDRRTQAIAVAANAITPIDSAGGYNSPWCVVRRASRTTWS